MLGRLAGGSLLLPAAPARIRNGDAAHRYRPDSEFFYVTGWDEPGGVALLRGFADEDRFVLFAPETTAEEEMWTGKRRDAREVQASCGADAVLPLHRFAEEAPGLMAAGERVHYRLGASERCDAAVRSALRLGRASRGRTGVGARAVFDPGSVLDELRLRKDEAEAARLRRAARTTVEGFAEALCEVRPGAGEWVVEAALDGAFRRRGATGSAYPTIVAAGANACTLHYTANASVIGAGDLVLLDGGAEADFYAADVTRTVLASDKVGQAARDVHAVVREAHARALAACRPGGGLAEVHEAAVRAVAEGLRDLGVLSGSADDIVESESYRPYFPHRTSHWLGLDVHDPGPCAAEGPSPKLEPGMAFTVEPGLYFRQGSCPAVPALEGIGARIEDDVLVSDEGVETLTADAPGASGDAGRRLVPIDRDAEPPPTHE